jgi:hypothetical protein
MKRVFSFFSILLLVLLVQVSSVWAVDFTVSANLDPATGVSITASSVDSTTKVFTTVGTTLSFDPLIFNTKNSVWLPDHFFAIDVAPTGGGGSTDTSVSYSEPSSPNDSTTGHGLGWKTTANFFKVSGTPAKEDSLTAHGKKMLKDLSGEHVLPAEVAGGYLRIYVGIVTKDPAAVPLDPASSETFTNVDMSGLYQGTLRITATAT